MRTTVLICLLGAGGAQASTLVTYEYDEVGRVLRERATDGRIVAAYTYDLVGNRTSVTNALGHKTTYTYDAFNRIVETVDAMGGRTKTAYDAGDRITQITDPRGLATTYLVDGFGRLLRETSPDRGTTTYTHDSAGRVTRMTRADGTWLAYAYDALGRVVSEGNDTEQRRYTYDICQNGKGRLCTGEIGSDVVRMGYTPFGELATRLEGIEGQDLDTYYFRDGAGRLTGLQYPDGMQVDYAYEGGELRSVHAEIGGQIHPVVTQIRYTPFDGIESWLHGNGLTRTYTRDADGRLTGIGVSHATGARQSLTYQYDAVNRITRITNGVDGSQTQTYGYDAMSRLTSAASGVRSTAYAHDANGNRRWSSDKGVEREYQIAAGRNRLLAAGSTQYAYDEVGNRIHQSDGQTEIAYHYDAFNRLGQVDKNDGSGLVSTRMRTNAFDQRTLKEGAGGTHRFVYVGQNQLLAERGAEGWRRYIWLGDSLIGMVTPQNATLAVHADHLGRPEVMTDQARVVVWRARNDAFDRVVTANSAGGMPLGFPGQYHDAEVDVVFNGYRYFDPSDGAYDQVDPLGLEDGTNPYAYVGGNPTMWIDPLGLEVFLCGQPAFGGRLPVDHQWIKTDTVEARMGTARAGRNAGNQGGDRYGDPVQVTDHSGRSNEPGSRCEKVEGVDEEKVNAQLEIGRPLGNWTYDNQCRTFTTQVLWNAQINPHGVDEQKILRSQVPGMR